MLYEAYWSVLDCMKIIITPISKESKRAVFFEPLLISYSLPFLFTISSPNPFLSLSLNWCFLPSSALLKSSSFPTHFHLVSPFPLFPPHSHCLFPPSLSLPFPLLLKIFSVFGISSLIIIIISSYVDGRVLCSSLLPLTSLCLSCLLLILKGI